MSDPLNNLRNPASAEPSDGDARPEQSKIMLDYAGLSGADQLLEHTAPRVMLRTGADPIAVHPGLNIFDAAQVEAYRDHKPFAAQLEAGHLREVNLERMTQAQIKALAMRSQQPDALEYLLNIEQARPVLGGRGNRRDQELVDLLSRRLRSVSRRRQLDTTGISQQAKAQAAVLSESPQQRFARHEREAQSV